MNTPSSTSSPFGAVAEVQGLYGTFSFPERLLQKIWQRGDFDSSALRLADGRGLRILHPGKWNHLGGPDFSAAKLSIDGTVVTGDVEMHLHAKDWNAHGHASDRAYDHVVLHVVLFPCQEKSTTGARGTPIPILSLLPLLHHGLEEYAEEEAMEQLAGRPLHHAEEALGALSSHELDTLLARHAASRWQTKVRFARERIARLGWEGACHHTAMEVLGYRFNRAPMLSIATARPLGEWAAGRVDPADMFAMMSDRWSLQGVRPLNHPRLRLRQYATWCAQRPDWPARLSENARLRELAGARLDAGIGDWRKATRLTAVRDHLNDEICGEVLGGSRFDNLVGDGFLPLLAAKDGLDLEAAWCGWFAGDAPASVVDALRNLAVFVARERPVAQGPIQGLLGWMLAQEAQSHG
ncbi:MAG: DUF2851 family protein [Rariglobus sp.]